MTAPGFTSVQFAEHVDAWRSAREALHQRDFNAVANILIPPQSNPDCYVRGITLCVTGAALIALEVAADMRQRTGPLHGMWCLDDLTPGEPHDPAAQCAAQCVTYALNGDHAMVGDLVNAFHRPDDPTPGSDLLFHLLTIYAGIGGGAR